MNQNDQNDMAISLENIKPVADARERKTSMNDNKSVLKITYMDGVSLSYEITAEQAAEYALGDKLESIMAARSFSMEVDGKLFVIPMTSIRTLEFSPSPQQLPPTTIKGLTPML